MVEQQRGVEARFTPNGLIADWLAWRGLRLGRPLAAVHEHGRPVHLFVEDELLVDARDEAALAALTGRGEGEVIEERPVPPPPRGMESARPRPLDGLPRLVRVRLRAQGEEAGTARARGEVLEVSSRLGARTLALAQRLNRNGGRVLLDSVGQSSAIPGSSSAERTSGLNDAYQWPEYAGPSNVARAWQLLQAYAQVRSPKQPVFLGIMDTGFALDGAGRPLTFPGQPADVTNYVQWNLTDEGQPAGGPSPEAGKEYHGNAVLSAAAAPLNNMTGVAGVGGVTTAGGQPVVVPVLFKTSITISEIYRCLQLCLAWGVDVVNMSFGIKFPKLLLPISGAWDESFQHAADQGLVVVCSAGNDNAELPDNVVFPATRTPGAITVGALDAGGVLARGDSNHGTSVDVWAPGTNIHAMPDPVSPGGSRWSQTSFASPIVAGTVALLKSIQPSLRSDDVKAIFRDTGHKDSPDSKVTVALDARAALLRVMGDRLPDGFSEEPNDTPAAARPLLPVPGGVLAPAGPTTLSHRRDQDWFSFQVKEYSQLLVTMDHVPELSIMTLDLVPDDPLSRAPGELQRTRVSASRVQLGTPLLAPGLYRLAVGGSAPNIYELRVQLTPSPLAPDAFEGNDGFETATRFSLRRPRFEQASGHLLDLAGMLGVHGPGTYTANLRIASDVDVFHVSQVPALVLSEAVFRVDATDATLDATLFGPGRVVLAEATQVRSLRFVLPTPECWVRISGATANRYVFTLHEEVKKGMLPGPLQREILTPVPGWLPDPPHELRGWEKLLQVELTEELRRAGRLRLTGSPGLTVEVLSPTTGQVLAAGERTGDAQGLVAEVDVSSLAPGAYVVRIGRALAPSARLDLERGSAVAQFKLTPGW